MTTKYICIINPDGECFSKSPLVATGRSLSEVMNKVAYRSAHPVGWCQNGSNFCWRQNGSNFSVGWRQNGSNFYVILDPPADDIPSENGRPVVIGFADYDHDCVFLIYEI